jgi:Co/Zn/Cd efflux system component
VWLCSRNDVIANVGVLLAAVGVRETHAAWPDIVVGLGIALVFMTSAFEVWRAALRPATGEQALVSRP